MRRFAAPPLPLPISIALSLALATSFAGPAAASASYQPARVALNGDRTAPTRIVTSVVTTDTRGVSGAWRVTLSIPGATAARSLRVTLTTGDEQFYGRIEVVAGTGSTARVVAHRTLDRWLAGGAAPAPLCDAVLQACVSVADVTVPDNGNGTLGVAFSGLGLGRGAYAVTGAARFAASVAFVYGPWFSTGSLAL